MEPPSSTDLRNIGIFAHIDAGKTSLTERILFLSGRLRSPGEVDSGTTATDYLAVERERGITVKAACVRLSWRDCAINLIDTPGHVDFGAEVERSLRVIDGVVLALCGVAGVQSRTETILKHCMERGLPLVAFVNKMDRRGASFERAFAEFAALCPAAVALQLPWGSGGDFHGIVDLIAMRAFAFTDDSLAGAKGSAAEVEIPAGLVEAARKARALLVERLAEGDEALLADFVAGREPAAGALSSALRAACVSSRLVPVLCGSAFSDGAVAFLLDAVAAYLPRPEERGCPEGFDPETGASQRRRPMADEAFSSLVFKTQADEHFGRLSWLRIWSGRLRPGDRVIEAGSGSALRVQRLFTIQADSLEDLAEGLAGDIVGVAFGASGKAHACERQAGGVAGIAGRLRPLPGSTGSSLCAPAAPIVYERIEFPEPVVSMALEPLSRADGEELKSALSGLVEDDPSLRVEEDPETGRVTLSGLGELHLEVALERLRGECGVRIRAGKPQVACREVLSGSAEASCDFDRDMNGERVRGKLSLRLDPKSRGSGHSLSATPGLRIPANYMEAFRRGVESSASVGPSASWPVEDFAATILAFAAPSSRQAELALEIAASMATRDCLASAGTAVLEPWMRLEVSSSEESLGSVVSALAGRGGRIEAIEDSGGAKTVIAAAPLRLLFGFASELRSATAGKAGYQAKFLRYEAAPTSRA